MIDKNFEGIIIVLNAESMNITGIAFAQVKMGMETIVPNLKKILKGLNKIPNYSVYFSIKDKKLDWFRIIEDIS